MAVYGPDITPGPALLLPDQEVEKQRNFLLKKIEKQEIDLANVQKELLAAVEDSSLPTTSIGSIQQTLTRKTTAYYPFDKISLSKGNVAFSPNHISSSHPAKIYDASLKAGIKGNALFNTDYSSAFLGEKVGWF